MEVGARLGWEHKELTSAVYSLTEFFHPALQAVRGLHDTGHSCFGELHAALKLQLHLFTTACAKGHHKSQGWLTERGPQLHWQGFWEGRTDPRENNSNSHHHSVPSSRLSPSALYSLPNQHKHHLQYCVIPILKVKQQKCREVMSLRPESYQSLPKGSLLCLPLSKLKCKHTNSLSAAPLLSCGFNHFLP